MPKRVQLLRTAGQIHRKKGDEGLAEAVSLLAQLLEPEVPAVVSNHQPQQSEQ